MINDARFINPAAWLDAIYTVPDTGDVYAADYAGEAPSETAAEGPAPAQDLHSINVRDVLEFGPAMDAAVRQAGRELGLSWFADGEWCACTDGRFVQWSIRTRGRSPRARLQSGFDSGGADAVWLATEAPVTRAAPGAPGEAPDAAHPEPEVSGCYVFAPHDETLATYLGLDAEIPVMDKVLALLARLWSDSLNPAQEFAGGFEIQDGEGPWQPLAMTVGDGVRFALPPGFTPGGDRIKLRSDRTTGPAGRYLDLEIESTSDLPAVETPMITIMHAGETDWTAVPGTGETEPTTAADAGGARRQTFRQPLTPALQPLWQFLKWQVISKGELGRAFERVRAGGVPEWVTAEYRGRTWDVRVEKDSQGRVRFHE